MTDGTEKCNPKIEENQREDRRAFRKFIVLLLVSMVVGGITGAFSTMARAMVTSYGMSDKIGPIDYGSEGGEIFLGRDFAAGKGYSEVKAAEIDDEIHRAHGRDDARRGVPHPQRDHGRRNVQEGL